MDLLVLLIFVGSLVPLLVIIISLKRGYMFTPDHTSRRISHDENPVAFYSFIIILAFAFVSSFGIALATTLGIDLPFSELVETKSVFPEIPEATETISVFPSTFD